MKLPVSAQDYAHMKRLLVAALVAIAVAVGTVGGAAAASHTVRLSIIHFVSGCHVWSTNKKPTAALKVKRGTALVIRISCPMDFSFKQTAGPKVALGNRVSHAGTARRIVFRKPGLYRFTVRNLQSSEQVGLQTLGPDNTLRLIVRVR